MDPISKLSELKNASFNLDSLLSQVKNLEKQSDLIIKEVFETQFALHNNESREAIAMKIENLKLSCKERWSNLFELQNNLKGYEAIKKRTDIPKGTQILLYEKELLTQQIANYNETINNIPAIDDSIIGRSVAEKAMLTSIADHRRLIAEMEAQNASLDLKIENLKRDLADLKSIGASLEAKIKEKEKSIETTPLAEVEKRRLKTLDELEAQAKKLTKVLYRLADAYYPAKSLQSSVGSRFMKSGHTIPSLKSILEILIKKSLENPNQYYQLPWGTGSERNGSEDFCRQAWEPYLNVLYLAYLIQFHPSDPSQVRLVNYQTFEG